MSTKKRIPVVDKYRPVSTEPTTVSPPVRIVLSVWAFALLLVLYGAPHLHRWITFQEDSWFQAGSLAALEQVEAVSNRIGMGYVRSAIDAVPAVLYDDTLRLFVTTEDAEPADSETVEAEVAEAESTLAPLWPPWDAPWAPTRPERLMMIGASSIQYYLGAELERRMETYADVEVLRYGKLSTGIARPDVFDWNEKAAELRDQFHPDVTFALFGGNDCQIMLLRDGSRASFNKPNWIEEYDWRLGNLLEVLQKDGSSAVMMGMPNMRSEEFSGRIEQINMIIETSTTTRGGLFIPSWDLSSNWKGEYRETVFFQGRSASMRLPDGIHYTRHGGEYIADRLLHRIEREFLLIPGDPELAVAMRVRHWSEARQKEVSYLAFVPQQMPEDGLVPLYLLHGAWGSWVDWSENAHQQVAELAGKYGLLIITPDGDEHGWYVDSPMEQHARIETYMMGELIPDVESRFPVAEQRIIMGLSMGGHGAIMLALRHPNRFHSASSMSGVLDISGYHSNQNLVRLLGDPLVHPDRWHAHSAQSLLEEQDEGEFTTPMRISVGVKDKWLSVNRTFRDTLEAMNVPHVYQESPAGHTWDYWIAQLPEHVEWHVAQVRPDRLGMTESPGDLKERGDDGLPETPAGGSAPLKVEGHTPAANQPSQVGSPH